MGRYLSVPVIACIASLLIGVALIFMVPNNVKGPAYKSLAKINSALQVGCTFNEFRAMLRDAHYNLSSLKRDRGTENLFIVFDCYKWSLNLWDIEIRGNDGEYVSTEYLEKYDIIVRDIIDMSGKFKGRTAELLEMAKFKSYSKSQVEIFRQVLWSHAAMILQDY